MILDDLTTVIAPGEKMAASSEGTYAVAFPYHADELIEGICSDPDDLPEPAVTFDPLPVVPTLGWVVAASAWAYVRSVSERYNAARRRSRSGKSKPVR